MQVDRYRAWAIEIEMVRPFSSARSSLDARRVIVIAAEGDGRTGWGEAAPVPGHTGSKFNRVWDDIQRLIATTTGKPRTGRVAPVAAAAFDQARSDLETRLAGVPLYRHLGGSGSVAASAAIGLTAAGAPDRAMLLAVVEAGYRNAKLKINPTTSIPDVAAVIVAHPDIAFSADLNGSFSAADGTAFAAIDALRLGFIEQPLPPTPLTDLAELCGRLTTPVAVDESVHHPEDVAAVIRAGAADILTLKPGILGVSGTVAAARAANRVGLAARIGGLLETGIGRAHAVALATLPEFSVVGDIAAPDLYLVEDIVEPPWRLDDGRFSPSARPGIGIEVDTDRLDRLSFDRCGG